MWIVGGNFTHIKKIKIKKNKKKEEEEEEEEEILNGLLIHQKMLANKYSLVKMTSICDFS